MKILITGNLGYVGSPLVRELRKVHPGATLLGFDVGYFAKLVTSRAPVLADSLLDHQYYGDVRHFPEEILAGVDTVVHLSAISNDPIGNKFEEVTLGINYYATRTIAEKAKENGVRNFVFASSCSVYGFAQDAPRTEKSELNPLTAYAKSKVLSEEALAQLADASFRVTCLRFATACGISDRLRLDLVLNDFTAGAVANGEINILSDGTPWRPLINVKDMARAIVWARERPAKSGDFLIINTGSNEWNYQVKELAEAIQGILPGTVVSINRNAQPDKRSYRVDFGLYRQLAPHHQPAHNLTTTIRELVEGLHSVGFHDRNFRSSNLIRLNVIEDLMRTGVLDHNLAMAE